VLGIRIGFNADPDPVFYLNEDPDKDLDLGSQTNVDLIQVDQDLDPDKTFQSQKVEFSHEKYT
jgi:hypothetical protein